jgi:hypothetical protein
MGKNLSNKVVFSHKLSCRCEEVHSSPIKVTDFRLMRSLVGTFLVFALGLTCHPVSADVSVNLANYLTYGTCPSGDPEYPNQGYVTPYGCWNPDLGFIVSSG